MANFLLRVLLVGDGLQGMIFIGAGSDRDVIDLRVA